MAGVPSAFRGSHGEASSQGGAEPGCGEHSGSLSRFLYFLFLNTDSSLWLA